MPPAPHVPWDKIAISWMSSLLQPVLLPIGKPAVSSTNQEIASSVHPTLSAQAITRPLFSAKVDIMSMVAPAPYALPTPPVPPQIRIHTHVPLVMSLNKA